MSDTVSSSAVEKYLRSFGKNTRLAIDQDGVGYVDACNESTQHTTVIMTNFKGWEDLRYKVTRRLEEVDRMKFNRIKKELNKLVDDNTSAETLSLALIAYAKELE